MNHAAPVAQGSASFRLRWFNVIVTSLFVLAAIALVTVTIASFLGRYDWRFDLIAHFRPHLAIMALVFALSALIFSQKSVAFVGLVCCVVQLPVFFTSIPKPIDQAAGKKLKVMTINVLSSNTNHAALIRLIKEAQPDLLALQEIDWDWHETARDVAELFPYSSVPAHRRPADNLIYSRYPILDGHYDNPVIGGRKLRTRAIFTTIDVEGTEIEFINIHPSHPMSHRLWSSRNKYMEWVVEKIDNLPNGRRVVLVGDWNLSPWSPWYQDFMNATGLKDAAAMSYGEPTRHPRGFPEFYLLGVTIDHIAVSPDIAVLESDVGPDIGSDHRPVTAIIQLP